MWHLVQQEIHSHLELVSAGQRPRTLLPVLLSRGGRSSRSFLVFADAQEHPCCYVKVSSDELGAARLEAEHRNLLLLVKKLCRSEVADGIPRPLFITKAGPATILGQTAVIGRSMSAPRSSALGRFSLSLEMVARWLVQWHQTTVGGLIKLDGADLPRSIEAILGSCHTVRMVDDHQFARVAQAVEDADRAVILSSYRHGDFKHEHVLIRNDVVSGVVDWESLDLCGVPGGDWFNFVTNLALEMLGPGNTAGSLQPFAQIFQRVFFGQGSLSQSIRTATIDYFTAIGADPGLIPAIFCHFLVGYAARCWPFVTSDKPGILAEATAMLVVKWDDLIFHPARPWS